MAAQVEVKWLGDKLICNNVEIKPSQFQSLAQGLIQRTWREMLQKLFLIDKAESPEKVVPKLDMDKLHDEPSRREPDWCFLNDSRTQMPVKGETWMEKRILNTPRLRKEFVQTATVIDFSNDSSEVVQSQPQWNTSRIERYLQEIGRFKEKLLILMHITGGPPPRSTDILRLRHRNPPSGDHRNMFIENGQIVYATMFLKPDSRSGTNAPQVIPRFMPKEVGQMIVYFLWLILPFQELLQAKLEKPSRSSPFMWEPDMDVEGKRWDKARLDEVLQRETEIGMGVKLNLPAYRKVAFAMMRRMMDTKDLFEDSEGEA